MFLYFASNKLKRAVN